MINLGASRPLAGDDLAAVATAEALVLPLLGHHLLRFLLAGDPPLPFLQLLGRRLVLQNEIHSDELIVFIRWLYLHNSADLFCSRDVLINKNRRYKKTLPQISCKEIILNNSGNLQGKVK